ncbi:PREDICTED: CDGSH iron-sulfur domain-containing protein 1-like [Chrysochloris asiatica]|uniref:CDGSH iron-sulfur domain-containing protein 2 n=1 Tax=Chrysochloris asiatica TaxID=185453 RepID=A0A9B0TCZ1_CHRAS|nr:PREDICTED: CDGSH iron-sulfur domain-containing protein 1-like [Chrysochloris asiatica]
MQSSINFILNGKPLNNVIRIRFRQISEVIVLRMNWKKTESYVKLVQIQRDSCCPREPCLFSVSCAHNLASDGTKSLTSNSSVQIERIAAVTIAAGTTAIGYLAYKRFYVKDHRHKSMVNLHIQKDNPKILHAFNMEDLGDKAVYCRCWRCKKFPLCDGGHTKHNEETGDNIGPLIIKKKET